MTRTPIFIALTTIAALADAGEPAPEFADLRAAVVKALPWLKVAAEGHLAERKCFACHAQTLPLMAMTAARERGFEVDSAHLAEQIAFTRRSLEQGRERYAEGRGQGGNVITAGYALWALELGEQPNDELSTLVAEYLLTAHRNEPHWRVTTTRPPAEAGPFAATYVALRALNRFGTSEQQPRLDERLAEVREWLVSRDAKQSAQETEDRIFRLRSLAEVGAERKQVRKAIKRLLKTQRDDGGWAQNDDMESDAYATGTALVALHEAGDLATDKPAYRRGLRYLLNTQAADGTWQVKTRAKPVQTHFETGFPYEKDQFISAAATAWATMAILEAVSSRTDE